MGKAPTPAPTTTALPEQLMVGTDEVWEFVKEAREDQLRVAYLDEVSGFEGALNRYQVGGEQRPEDSLRRGQLTQEYYRLAEWKAQATKSELMKWDYEHQLVLARASR